jgi:hypothetical protein
MRYSGDESQENEIGGACGTHGGQRNAYRLHGVICTNCTLISNTLCQFCSTLYILRHCRLADYLLTNMLN